MAGVGEQWFCNCKVSNACSVGGGKGREGDRGFGSFCDDSGGMVAQIIIKSISYVLYCWLGAEGWLYSTNLKKYKRVLAENREREETNFYCLPANDIKEG